MLFSAFEIYYLQRCCWLLERVRGVQVFDLDSFLLMLLFFFLGTFMTSIRKLLSEWWVKFMQDPPPEEVAPPPIVKTAEQRQMENTTGFTMIEFGVADTLIDGHLFCKVGKKDKIIGVFSKMFLFEETPPEEEYNGIVMVALIELPLTPDMLHCDVQNRKCYSGEVIYKGKYETDDQVSYRGILEPSTLDHICLTINDVNYWQSMDEARKLVFKNLLKSSA